MRFRTVGPALFGFLCLGLASPSAARQTRASVAPSSAVEELRTPAERSGFAENTPYDSMWAYLRRLEAGAPEMRLASYGTSGEGRDLPYAIFARPAVSGPVEGRALGKPVVVLAAGVHGDEPTLRESVLLIARDLATEGTSLYRALDRLTVLVVPQLNPDGFSQAPTRRGNAGGVDLNRDYMKLEHPEIRAYVQNILIAWDPQIFVDGHDGGSFPYNLHYQCPSHAGSDPRLTHLCDERIFPAVEAKLGAEGYRAWYYQAGTRTRWDVGEPDPRIGRNYGGLANQVGILFESPPTQDRADAVRSGVLAYETVVEWAGDNVELLIATLDEARRETVRLGEAPEGDIPIETGYAPEPGRVRYLIGAGQDLGDIVEVESDSLMKRPVPTLTRPRPWAYVLPPTAGAAVELLTAHGIDVERVTRADVATVSAYPMVGVSYETAYDHPAAVRLEVADVVLQQMTVPAGSFVVRTGQVRGRVAAHLLEPESRDGVVYWNRMDDLLPTAEIEAFSAANRRGAAGTSAVASPNTASAPLFPIYKLMEPVTLSVEPSQR